MIEMTRWDKALWFLSGSIVLAAVIFLASSRETGANPPGQCGICGQSCVQLECHDAGTTPSEGSCKGERDRRCRRKTSTCLSKNMEFPYPRYDFYCGATCKQFDPQPYNMTYLSAWTQDYFPAGTAGPGFIGYKLGCPVDPEFFGQGGDCCQTTEQGATFETEIKVVVCMYVGSVYTKTWTKTWFRRRTITQWEQGSDGTVRCSGQWDPGSAPVNPSAVQAALEQKKELDCRVENYHWILIEVEVYVTFRQNRLALNGEPGGEAAVTDIKFQCQ